MLPGSVVSSPQEAAFVVFRGFPGLSGQNCLLLNNVPLSQSPARGHDTSLATLETHGRTDAISQVLRSPSTQASAAGKEPAFCPRAPRPAPGPRRAVRTPAEGRFEGEVMLCFSPRKSSNCEIKWENSRCEQEMWVPTLTGILSKAPRVPGSWGPGGRCPQPRVSEP